jgi:O-acetylserine/cysteine efflux transporter
MSFIHTLLALLVVVIWGFNFIFIKFSLNEFSPLFLCALRFLLASIPAIFFIKLPRSSIKKVMGYGLIMFALQFSFVFTGMHVGMTPGMASLIMQVQVFFSMFFAAFILDEKPTVWQIGGALVSFMGIGLVALHLDNNISLLGFILILGASASWGVGNLMTKTIHHVSMMALVIWGCFFAAIPMTLIALVVDGSTKIVADLQHVSLLGASSVFYIVYLSTWVGYGIWNWLIRQYPISVIVPFTLLVPVVGILSSIFLLGETFQWWKMTAGLLVITGLYINLLSSRLSTTKLQGVVEA